MDSATPDYEKLSIAVSTITPSEFLFFDGLTWQSWIETAKAQPLTEFLGLVEQVNPNLYLDIRTSLYLWLAGNGGNQSLLNQETPKIEGILRSQNLNMTLNTFNTGYQQWLDQVYRPTLNLDQERFNFLANDLNIISNTLPLSYTPLKRERLTLNSVLNVEFIDGLTLLDMAKVSPQLPLIINNDINGKFTIKVYDDELDGKHKYANLIDTVNKIKTKGSLYFILPGEPRIIKLTYLTEDGEYILNPELTYTASTEADIARVQTIITEHTNLDIGDFTVKDVVYSFNFILNDENYTLNASELLIALTGNGLLARYLRLDESREIFLEKTRAIINYHRPFNTAPLPKPDISIILAEQVMLSGSDLIAYDYPSGDEVTFPGTEAKTYLNVVMKGSSEAILASLQSFLIPLLSYLYTAMAQTVPFLETWISGYKTKNKLKNKYQADASQRKIARLRRIPDIFDENYSKKCTQENQPDVITDLEAFQAQTFEWQGQSYNRLALSFGRTAERTLPYITQPDGNIKPNIAFEPELGVTTLGCLSDHAPFIGIKDAKSANPDKTPYTVCCYNEDQNIPGKTLYKYLNGIETGRGVVPINAKIIQNYTYLNINREGIVLPSLQKLVSQFDPEYEPEQIYRLGVAPLKDTGISLLHALLNATDNDGYMLLYQRLNLPSTLAELETYAQTIRADMVAKTNPAVLAQELYDLSPAERLHSLGESKYLDPRKFYRALEEYFQVNIVLFTDVDEGSFQLPRSRGIPLYSRVNNNRPVVLVLTSAGSTVNKTSTYLQSELIVVINNGNKIKRYSPKVLGFLRRTQDACQTFGKTKFDPANQSLTTTINSRYSPYQLGGTLLGQSLDANGKGVGVVVKINGTDIPLYTPPFAPLNLPVVALHSLVWTPDIGKVLPAPVAISDTIPGLWFNTEYESNQFFLPLVNYTSVPIEALPVYSFILPDISSLYTYSINNSYQIQRQANLFFQLMLYTYIIFLKQNDLTDDYTNLTYLGAFIDQYVSLTNQVKIYNFSQLDRILPQDLTTVDTLLPYWAKHTTGLIVNGKIELGDDTLSQRLIQNMQRWLDSHRGDNLVLPLVFDGYFERETDFKPNENQRVFMDWNIYRQWLSQSTNTQIKTRASILTTKLYDPEPYIYQDKNDNYFIIQNVTYRRYDLALTVAIYWREHKYNPGHNPKPLELDGLIPAVDIYHLDPENQLTLEKEITNGALRILEFDNGYSAVLPLNMEA